MSRHNWLENDTEKFLTAITAVIMLSGLTTALSSPNTTQIVTLEDPANFTVQDNQAENVTLRLQPPKEATQALEMNKTGNTFSIELDGSNFPEKGLYHYSFITDAERFPQDGNFSLTVSSRNESLENKTLNVSDTESQLSGKAYCDYKSDPSDFTCEYENFQAGMILSSAIGLQLNSSEYAREKFENFTFGSYGSGFTNCNQAEPEFDCETSTGGSGYYESLVSGTRQGSLINSLWKAYGLTGNESVRELAMNYTEGSAEDCDVWNNSFNCSTPRAQGLMALGYWSAYEKTGNNTFKSIAEDLTGTNYSHPLIPSAYFRAYVFTSNSSYLSEAENRTREWLNDCPNCTSDEMNSLKNTLWTGYRATGDYGYYRNAVNLTSYSSDEYCSWNSSSCKNPYIQGLSTYNYWKALKSQKDLPEVIFNFRIDKKTVVGQNLTVDVDFQGKIEDPELMYRKRTTGDSSWMSCDISYFEGCEIPGGNISQQGPYSYKFQSETVSFPRNGSFSFAPSLVKNTFIDEARSFSTNDPERRCAPSEGDFECEDRALQAPMIKGFTDYLNFNMSVNSQDYVRNILNLPYATRYGSSNGAPFCTSKDRFMSCGPGGEGILEQDVEGSVRQGRMIKSLFSTYQENDRGKTYQRAMNYSLGAAEDCDVWNRTFEQSFECGSTQGQSEMIEAYLKAYDVTGNLTFREKALNLTEEALSMSKTSELGSALWEASSYFNESYRGLNLSGTAENISENFTGYCSGNCSVDQYVGFSNLFRDAFLFSENDYSSEYRSAVLNTTEDGECGPYKQDVSCSYPSGQGELMDLMWGSAYTMPVEIKVDDSFNTSKDTLTVGQQFSTTCSAQNNLENTTIQNVEFNLSTSEGLDPVSENTSYDAGDLQYGNSSEVSWDIEATSAGDRNASCAITSDSGYRDTINKDINIEAQEIEEEEDTSSGSDSSSSSGGFIGGGFTDTEEIRNQTIVYNSTFDIQWNRTLLEQLGINTTYRNYSQRPECFSPVRKIRGNNMTLDVQSNCSADGAVLIDRIPANTSLKTGRAVKGLAVERSSDLNERTELGLEYRGKNTSNFGKPLVLTSNFTLPPLEMVDIGSQRDGSSALISADLNKEASCSVYNQGKEVYTEETDNLVFQPSLDYGNATYRVECGDQSFTRTFTRERPQTKKEPQQDLGSIPVSWGIGALILAIIGLGLKYREEIINEAEMKIFEYRFNRFETAVEQGNTAEAIEAFDSMSRDISQEVLESDMDLMKGLMLYLLIDLVEEGKDHEVSLDVSDDLDELVQRYLGSSDGKAIRLVREKYEEATGREM